MLYRWCWFVDVSYTHIHTHPHTDTDTHTHIYIYIYIYICMYVCVSVLYWILLLFGPFQYPYFLQWRTYIGFGLILVNWFCFFFRMVLINNLLSGFVLDIELSLDWDDGGGGWYVQSFCSVVSLLLFILDWLEASSLAGVVRICFNFPLSALEISFESINFQIDLLLKLLGRSVIYVIFP